MDGKPIQHVFLLAIPADGDKTHIRMLSELAMMLVRKEARTALNQIQTRQELYEIL
jgi:mannitol/fructose-specific phosphotransferase system IIA component (Ntr-type)